MTVRAWRLTKAKYADAAFSSEGARLYGGRWNSPGWPVVYTSSSASLAMLELLVHLRAPQILERCVVFEIKFDERIVTTLDRKRLPRSWRESPPPTLVQRIGDEWLGSARSAILRVPSVIVPAECNYLLNPDHPDFSRVAIGTGKSLRVDPRLTKPPAG